MGKRHSHQNYDVYGELSYVSVHICFLQSSPQTHFRLRYLMQILGHFSHYPLILHSLPSRYLVPFGYGAPDLHILSVEQRHL